MTSIAMSIFGLEDNDHCNANHDHISSTLTYQTLSETPDMGVSVSFFEGNSIGLRHVVV